MKKSLDLLKKSLWKLWEGFLQNFAIVLSAFILSGGYLVAINKLKAFQEWVREIPTDYILTPTVLLLILAIVLLRITHKQQQKISNLEHKTPTDDKESRMVTHCGVWWKLYPDDEYIEDFPYCPCCEQKQKLVQTEWYPDEKYICPQTKTEVLIYDEIPIKRNEILDELYTAY